ncbi:hypothetical protein ZWY2020_054071 [Hordeum vulgare]|nr:hypothetical protein ZWY2020_054071 [Hordeum vulgare]
MPATLLFTLSLAVPATATVMLLLTLSLAVPATATAVLLLLLVPSVLLLVVPALLHAPGMRVPRPLLPASLHALLQRVPAAPVILVVMGGGNSRGEEKAGAEEKEERDGCFGSGRHGLAHSVCVTLLVLGNGARGTVFVARAPLYVAPWRGYVEGSCVPEGRRAATSHGRAYRAIGEVRASLGVACRGALLLAAELVEWIAMRCLVQSSMDNSRRASDESSI